MAAYSPISFKVFGNELVSASHRLSFLRSLVLSRLLFNVYICVLTARDYVAHNGVYMRGLRRIAGDPRFSADVQYTDLQVRALLKMPSVDCFVSQLRLAYLGRIVRARPRGLLGLLHLRDGTRRLPWVMEVGKDCERLRVHGLLPASFPGFFDAPDTWLQLIADAAGWKNLVDQLFFLESVTDRSVKGSNSDSPTRALAYACARCDRAFASQLALEAHCRVKHGDRLDIRRFVRDSVCPACATDYRERIRCIAHLSDRRRPACADWVQRNVPPLSDAELQKLDEVDRALRRSAWRQGHTHHIAKLPAIRKNGRAIGRISA